MRYGMPMTRRDFVGIGTVVAGTVLFEGPIRGSGPTQARAQTSMPPTVDRLMIRVIGGGEAIATDHVRWIGHDLVERNIPTVCRPNALIPCPLNGFVGNHITFGFTAIKRCQGDVCTVSGQMLMIDHTLGLVFHSDVAVLVDHPIHRRPVGSEEGMPNGKRIQSSVGGVMLNGQPLPGWRLDNSPVYDGGSQAHGTGDVVCFELHDFTGSSPTTFVMEWIGFVTGEVRIEEIEDLS